MKILFVGVLDVDWSTNRPMKRVLENLGHRVVPFNYRTIAYEHNSTKRQSAKLFDKWLDKLSSFLRSSRVPIQLDWYYNRKGRKEMNELLLETVKEGQFDLVLFCKTDSVKYCLLTEINRYSPTWYFFMDWMNTALGINAKEYAKRCTWSSATYSDVNELFKKYNANSLFLTQGVDKSIFFPNGDAKEKDVIFVGTANKRRAKIITYLKNNRVNVACFGVNWNNGPIYREQLAEIYRRAKIVLNLQYGCPRKQGAGFSIRVFEAMATGSFVLSEYCADIKKVFERKKDLDWFEGQQECLQLVNHYLEKQDNRERIAAEGCKYVIENYSWEKVINDICEIVKTDRKKSYS